MPKATGVKEGVHISRFDENADPVIGDLFWVEFEMDFKKRVFMCYVCVLCALGTCCVLYALCLCCMYCVCYVCVDCVCFVCCFCVAVYCVSCV